MLIDASGTLHVAYVVGAMPWPCAVRFAQKTVTGWTDTVVEPETRCGISLAMDSKEVVHIVYPRQFNLAHAFKDGDDWQIEVVDTLSWVGGEDTTLAIDGADRLHVAYYDQNDDLKYATNLNGAWQHYFINGAITSSPSIAVDPTGRVSIAYSDQVDGTVKLMVKP